MRSRTFRVDLVLLGIYVLLAGGLTLPLALHLATHIPGPPVDGPALAWNQWWFKFSVFDLQSSPFYTNYIFYPIGVNLLAFTSTFLNSILSLPLQFAFGVIPANNLVVFAALVLSGYGVFLLARQVLARCAIESDLAAALAGAFFLGGAWHIDSVSSGQFNLMSSEWIPFYALFLIRMDGGNLKNAVLAGMFFVMAAWTELTFIPFLALFTLVWLADFVFFRRRAINSKWLTRVALLGLVVGAGVSPIVWNLIGDTLRYGYYLAPGLGRAQIFSADLTSFIFPSGQHPFFGSWAKDISHAARSYALIGVSALLLAGVGWFSQRRMAPASFWGIVAIVFGVLMLGPTLIVDGRPTGIPMPFALLRLIPFVNANRYPVRFNAMLMLGVAVLMALGAARLLQWRRGRIMLAALCVLLAVEQLILPLPLADLQAPAVYASIRSEAGDFSILDLPLGWRNSTTIQGKIDYTSQFLQTVHNKRLLSGQTSRNPAVKFQYFLELPLINSLMALENGQTLDDAQQQADHASAEEVARFFDIRYVQVETARTDPAVLDYVRQMLPLTQVSQISDDSEHVVYRVNLPERRGGSMDPGRATSALYFDEGWGRPQADPSGFGYRWATTENARLWLPLSHSGYRISFRLRAPLAEKVQLNLNGDPLAQLDASTTWTDATVVIPVGRLRAGLNEFTFSASPVPITSSRQDNYLIGKTGNESPVDVEATGAGFDAGNFGHIYVQGKSLIPSRRGYHLVAIDAHSGAVDRVGSFDTFADPRESQKMADLINQLPAGEIVAGVAIDDVSRALTPVAITALRSLGVESNLQALFRSGHAFIGVKGAQPGQALEQTNQRFPANVSVGKDVASDRVSFALGPVSFEPFDK